MLLWNFQKVHSYLGGQIFEDTVIHNMLTRIRRHGAVVQAPHASQIIPTNKPSFTGSLENIWILEFKLVLLPNIQRFLS